MPKLQLWMIIKLSLLNPTTSDLWKASAYISGLVLSSVAKYVSYKEKIFSYSIKTNQTLWPKQSSDFAFVLYLILLPLH